MIHLLISALYKLFLCLLNSLSYFLPFLYLLPYLFSYLLPYSFSS